MKTFFLIFCIVIFAFYTNPGSAQLASVNVDGLKTFGTMGKELTILTQEHEVELFQHKGKGCITHMWFGGSFDNLGYTTIRIYVDGEEKPSIDMDLYLGHGIGFKDKRAPWGNQRMGNIGGISGIYDTYKIPFGKSIRITGLLQPGGKEKTNFWWIIRGTENLPVTIAGVHLPENARLKLYKLENYEAEPLEVFALCNVSGSGLLWQVTMQAKALRKTGSWKDLSFMESVIRAYTEGENPLFLSSGLEDYFLGTYYFNTGYFTTPLAGVTHFDKKKSEFSAFRLHEDDPVFFKNGLKLTCRCGEKIGDNIFHYPPKTRYTTYTWVYEW